MGSEGVGECSRKTEGDSGDDSSGDPDRPLKKARYVWQVKGKYHLKDSHVGNNHNLNNNPEDAGTNHNPRSPEVVIEDNANYNTVNRNVGPSDLLTPEGLLEQAEEIMASDGSSDDEYPPRNIYKSISDDIPVTLVKPNRKNHDYYLMKWQARQVAKGFLDNTINKVLENWMAPPFDATDLIENCQNDEQVEDEGIRMAIQSHGLQSGSQNWDESRNSPSNMEASSTCIEPQEIAESTMDNYQNVHAESLQRETEDLECSNCNENIEVGDHTNFLDAAVSVAIQKKGLTSPNFM